MRAASAVPMQVAGPAQGVFTVTLSPGGHLHGPCGMYGTLKPIS